MPFRGAFFGKPVNHLKSYTEFYLSKIRPLAFTLLIWLICLKWIHSFGPWNESLMYILCIFLQFKLPIQPELTMLLFVIFAINYIWLYIANFDVIRNNLGFINSEIFPSSFDTFTGDGVFVFGLCFFKRWSEINC